MNSQADLIFLKLLQDTIESLDKLEELINSNGERQSKIDLELSDLLHLLENGELSDNAYISIAKRIRLLRRDRRALRNEYELINKYNELKNRLLSKENRQFLIAEIQKRMKVLNQPYNNRILKEEDVKELINVPASKNTIKKINSKIDTEKLLELTKKGWSQTKIAKEFGVSQSAISMYLRKIKEDKKIIEGD